MFAGPTLTTSGSTVIGVLTQSSSANVDATFVNNTIFTGDVGAASVDTIGMSVRVDDLVLVNNLFARGTDSAIGGSQYLIRFNPPTGTNTIEIRNNAFSEPSGTLSRIYGTGVGVIDTEAELNDAAASTDSTGPASGNQIAVAVFTDALAGDFSLLPATPAEIRTGGTDVSAIDAALATDLEDNARPGADGSWSIGAIEYQVP